MSTPTAHYALVPGTLAYVDSFGGLIPCKVTACHDRGSVTVRYTADRPGYRRGELETFDGNDRVARVIPRTAVYTRGGQYRIYGAPVVAYPAPAADYTLAGAR